MTEADARFEFVIVEGGRFCERPRSRLAAPELLGMLPGRLFIAGALPCRLFVPGATLPERLFVMGALRVGIFWVPAR